jgi:prepilin-type N-terminal cleavage/methylation domain-containing protein
LREVQHVKKTRAAFTLLELTITLGIISILVVLLLPALAKMRARAQRVQCMGNPRSLHIAAEQYLQDNNQWPQIRTSSTDTTGSVYAQKWIAALAPYQILPKAWMSDGRESPGQSRLHRRRQRASGLFRHAFR